MNQIEHIIDPARLLLVWRAGHEKKSPSRRIVAEIVRPAPSESPTLRYLVDTNDYDHAIVDGFLGYPAFPIKNQEYSSGVLDSFLRRLPPRKRDDFETYLRRHRLPSITSLPDMALLAYTNAKLPSDSFELFPDLTKARPPFELIIEVAGFRHQQNVSADDLYIGDPVTFKRDKDNAHDENAVAIFHSGKRIGFVDRAQAPSFCSWFKNGFSVSGNIDRVNNQSGHPIVYIFVSVR